VPLSIGQYGKPLSHRSFCQSPANWAELALQEYLPSWTSEEMKVECEVVVGHGLTACAIEQTVARLDGLVHGVGCHLGVDLPETEAHLGHVMAAAELDVGNLNHLDMPVLALVGW